MNLNQIQLPASVIAKLYRHCIVETGFSKIEKPDPLLKKTTDQSADQWKYLGENKKNILVIVNYNDAVYLHDEDLTFLTNILSACKLSLADVAIVNRNNYQTVDYKELLAQFASKIVFLFGVDPVSLGLPLSFPHYQVQSFNKTTFLFVPSMDQRTKDPLYKSKLWVCLRRIFGV